MTNDTERLVSPGCTGLDIKSWREETMTETKIKGKQGFASMDREKQRRIASEGGKIAHRLGKAHQWTAEEAQRAGRRGGAMSKRRSKDA